MRHVIIGGSAAGISCAESIRRYDKKAEIILVGDENKSLYSRCLLSYLLAGSIKEDGIYFKDKDFFKKNNVETILGVRADKIDVKSGNIILNNKKKIAFDRLLIATGSRSKMLAIPGIDKKGVFALRNIADASGILGMLGKVKTAVVLGGGLIGLKAAHALKARGAAVKIVVKSQQVLSQILDAKAASFMQARIEEDGIEVMKGLEASQIVGKESVEAVLLDNGSKIECQLVIIGKGVSPNTELSKGTDIEVHSGVVVNDNLGTAVENIFAAGDVAETFDIAADKSVINAIWPAAVEQGAIAGKNMTGAKVKYAGSLAMNSIEFFGLPVISIGLTRSPGAGYEELAAADEKTPTYKKVILKDGVLCGFIAVGAIENAGVYSILIKNKIDVSSIKGALLDINFNYAKAMPLIQLNKNKFDKEEFRDSIITY